MEELRKQVQHLQPVVRIGKAGLGQNIIIEIKKQLKVHHLVKIKLLKNFMDDIPMTKKELGDALTVKKNYASEAQKLKDQIKTASSHEEVKKHKKRIFIYAFNMLDIKTNMYVATGTSFKSEKSI